MIRSLSIAFFLFSLLAAPALAAAGPRYPAALQVDAAAAIPAPTDDSLFGRGEQAIVVWDDPSPGDALR